MEVTVQAEPRERSGKGVARKLRATGKIPGILYGRGMEPVRIALDRRELGHVLHTEAGRNVLIDLRLDGRTYLTLAREIQRHPVRGELLHVDLVKIDRDVAIEVEVPIHLVGDARGVKTEGGVIEHHTWTVTVRCLPTAVPERIDADVSGLGINESLRVEALRAPDGVEIVTPAEEIIVSCVTPQLVEEAAPGAEAAEAAAAEGVPGEGGTEG